MLLNIIDFISFIDIVTNNAYISIKYHYVKPILNTEYDGSYLNVKQARHPIIERIIEHEYVPHDILLNNETSGIMIYGPNSAGKSAIMKTPSEQTIPMLALPSLTVFSAYSTCNKCPWGENIVAVLS